MKKLLFSISSFVGVKRCRECSKKLMKSNKSGFCVKCYRHSEQFLEYQRKKQLEYFHQGRYKEQMKKNNERPEVKERRAIYVKSYHQRPDVKAKKAIYDKLYQQRSNVKERLKSDYSEYEKEYDECHKNYRKQYIPKKREIDKELNIDTRKASKDIIRFIIQNRHAWEKIK